MQKTIDSLLTATIRKPNFFLLGAGRCASTSLYGMLRQHPQIFMPSVKEPSYFCSYFQVVKDPISYFQLFQPAPEQIAIGEASHVYLSNPESAPVIHALFPEARFILIFRNPTDRAYSLYQWARQTGVESLQTFEQALDAEDHRYADAEFFRHCPQYFWNFMYARSSRFHEQWMRYLQFYPRERFFVLSLNELAKDPLYWMKRMFAFLGVDSAFQPKLEHLNASEPIPMLPETRRRLDTYFRDCIHETNALAGRDLNLR